MNNETKLPPDFKAKWVAALRSGEYAQGPAALYNREHDSYCCWGVACVLLGMPKESIEDQTKQPSWIGMNKEDWPITKIIDINHDAADLLAEMNDGTGGVTKKYTFEEIADYIEANL